ncbi:MAG: class I SAM-dependent methyltransferase [Candidatus Micrarchaeia archaeon]
MKYNKKEQISVWDSIASGWSGWRNQVRRDVIEFSKEWKPGKLLDIGCGSGRNLFHFAEKGFDWYGIDFSKEMINKAIENFKRKNIDVKGRLKVGDMTELPFQDESFDYIISIASFHHLPKEEQLKTIKEMKRVLKENGEMIISVWNKYSFKRIGFWFSGKETLIPWKKKEKGIEKEYNRYYYLFSYGELKKLIQMNGFKIKKSSGRFDENITFLIKKL